jgi:membrane protease YdiL (CAAX protease family)
MPGGILSYLFGALVIGLPYGWVAWRTGSIRWTAASHGMRNLLGLGATLYFAP